MITEMILILLAIMLQIHWNGHGIHIKQKKTCTCCEYQMSQDTGIKDNYYWNCEVCARICPIGNYPAPLKILSDIQNFKEKVIEVR